MTILCLLLLPGILYRWQSTLQMDWPQRRGSKYRKWRFSAIIWRSLSQMTTWSFQIWGFDHNVSPQLEIFHSLRMREIHWCQSSKMWPTCNRVTLNITQSSILMWRVSFSSCHSFLRTFAPKYSYGEIFFISRLELVDKVLTPNMKKKWGSPTLFRRKWQWKNALISINRS